jgi:hypothetical protein
MYTEAGHFFTCKSCHAHELRVINEYTRYKYYERTRECTCEESDSEYGIVQEVAVEFACTSTGLLNEGHRVDWDDEIEEDEVQTEVRDEQIQCGTCRGESSEWQSEYQRSENDDEQSEYYVRCAGCDREIEFGYSHPNQGGRIWPAECPDFKSWLTIPDHKYVESWKAKGWIRSSGRD